MDCPTCTAAQALLRTTEALRWTGEATEHNRRAVTDANELWDRLPKRSPHTCGWAPVVTP